MSGTSEGPLHELPKAELHVHLDGSLRPETMLELASERDIRLPAEEAEALANFMRADDTADLVAYLARFELTLSLMQDAEALERITHELVVDFARENTRYLEIRYSPILHTRGRLTLEETVEAPLRGLKRGLEATGVGGGLIVCAIRSMEPFAALTLAELAVAFRGRGVLGFDLAGAEAGYPPVHHRTAFERATAGGLPVTVHAGEAWGPASIAQALDDCSAVRIGHGTRLHEDPELEERVRELGIPLEICLTSNEQTGVTPRLSDHPVRRYFDLGIPVALCTDNRLVSGTTLTREYERARNELGFTLEELERVAKMGFEAGFLSSAGALSSG